MYMLAETTKETRDVRDKERRDGPCRISRCVNRDKDKDGG